MGCVKSKAKDPAKDGAKEQRASASKPIEKEVKEGGFTNKNWIFDNKGKVTDMYDVESKKLGQGTYGSVSKATHKETHQIRAVKSISKASSQVKNIERWECRFWGGGGHRRGTYYYTIRRKQKFGDPGYEVRGFSSHLVVSLKMV